MSPELPRHPRASESLREAFRADGFALISDLFGAAETAGVRAQFFELMKAQAARCGVAMEGAESAWSWRLFADPGVRSRLYELCQDLSSAHRLANDARVEELCRRLGLTIPLRRNTTLRIDYPGDDRVLQPAHQDIRAVRSSNCLNFWVPLQKVDPTTGGLRVYVGSPADGPVMPDGVNASGYQTIPPEILQRYRPLTLSLEAGEALVFNPFLIHESTANRGDDVRLTWVFRYDDGAAVDWLRTGKPEFAKFDAQR